MKYIYMFNFKTFFYLLKLQILIILPLIFKKILYFLLIYILYIDFFIMSIIIPLIISVAYVTLIERKVIGLCN